MIKNNRVLRFLRLCLLGAYLVACNAQNVNYDTSDIMQVNPDKVFYYSTIPIISGTTNDVEPEVFMVKLTLAYPSNNRKVGLEISNKQKAIIEAIRIRLSTYTAQDFNYNNERRLKKIILEDVNKLLSKGQLYFVLFDNVTTYPLQGE
jgi:flagellar basal body-associated protein FliL